jgi:hypothetical protein
MGTTENVVIELYDIGPKGWVGYETNTLVSVSNVETLLYRSDGVSDGPGMSDEEEKLLNAGKPRKRPVELLASSSNRVVRPRLQLEEASSKLPESRSSPAIPASTHSAPKMASKKPLADPSKASATPQNKKSRVFVIESSDSDQTRPNLSDQ